MKKYSKSSNIFIKKKYDKNNLKINIKKNIFIFKKFFFYKHIYIKKFKINNNKINNNDNNDNKILIFKKYINFINNLIPFKVKNEIKYIIKFCVFLGREKNMKILHSYIELGLEKEILDEYHMFDFSRTINDHNFIYNEYKRLKILYQNRIFLHNYEENNLYKNMSKNKVNWNIFYKKISQSHDNDIIIKCDDDILFIDIYSLKNAIKDRIIDKRSFLIHSNCINNGVCTYFQSNFFLKLKDHINKYPTGGLLGPIFEKPEIGYVIQNQFTHDLLLDLNNLNKYVIEDQIINSRISINFILINGCDTKYLSDVSFEDEYELSSLIPEKLGRHNKIKGDLITAHLSYSLQDKIILHRDDLLINYRKICEKYINLTDSIINMNFKNININTYIPKVHINNNIYKIKNWINDSHFYIKNYDTNQYLNIDYENDELVLSLVNKSIFQVINKTSNFIEIKLGIYFLSRYNTLTKFRNEVVLLKYLKDEKERELFKEPCNIDNVFYLKYTKYNNYLVLNQNTNLLEINNTKLSKWLFEKVDLKDEYIYATQFIKNNKIYYKNIKNNEIYTNYYKGWALENILW